MIKRLLAYIHIKFTKIKRFHWTSAIFLTIIANLYACGGHLYHVVEPGETLYAISWMYGQDYKTVAQWNNIRPPYILHKGQRIRVAPIANERLTVAKSSKNSVTGSIGTSKDAHLGADKPDKINKHKSSTKTTKYVYRHSSNNNTNNAHLVWRWPVKQGTVTQTFKANDPGKRGIDIEGKEGQTIYSSSTGTVVYSGNGLPLYGNLIIIKHNDTYLSAYAHNKKLLVKEGDEIRAGQAIARMGNTGTNDIKLHFEIRRDGKPVDPMSFLPYRMPN
jgi:lipoprotein NlpD